MSIINTSKLLGRLEKLIDFRIEKGASKKYLISLQENNSCPATDGTQIFLPRRENHFASERDNELSIANSTVHEADHIREINEYFGAEAEQLREQKENLVEAYHNRNFAELKENPALAGWINNIVKDRRIDAERREQLPGVRRYHEETLNPAAEYLRPSIKGMSKLDAFREQYLQKALIDKAVEPVPEEHKALLEEVVSLTSTADSIQRDQEVVSRIYQRLKENFDITQQISKLPPMLGRGDNSQPSSGQPQQGYGKEVKPREGREEGKRPKKLNKGEGKSYKPDEKEEDKPGNESNKKKQEEDTGRDDKDRTSLYKQAQDKYGIVIQVVEPQFSDKIAQIEKSFRDKYAGEIESMKRIFRQLQLKHYGDKRDFQGQELDYEEYMQSELESKVTGIKGNRSYFRRDTQNEQRPAFGIHADISGSTRGEIIEQIKSAFYIVGNALSASDWDYGLYASADNLVVLKEPVKKWNDAINHGIMALKAGGEGIYLSATNYAISEDLKRTDGNPKCLIVISDFEVCGEKNHEYKTAKILQDQKIYPFYIAIGSEHESNAKEMTREIGDEHYSVIPINRLYELPEEMFRLFKTFGIAR